jgi:hypothetical protein
VSDDQPVLKSSSTEDVQAYTLAKAAPFLYDEIESGVRIVVSNAVPVSAGRQFREWLIAAVRDLRSELRPFVPMVVVMMAGGESSLATAAGDAAIIVWCRREQWNSGTHAQVTAETLEHEAAHIVQIRTGRPPHAEWEATMREDAVDGHAALSSCLVLPDIANTYEAAEWIREDWAYSVQMSRDPAFAPCFPSRAAAIAEHFRA